MSEKAHLTPECYFTPIDKNGKTIGVWHLKEDNYAFKIGVPRPNEHSNSHCYIEDGQPLLEAMSNQMPVFFQHGAPCTIKQNELNPGEYYKRIARPNDQHPNEGLGLNCPDLEEFSNHAELSKGQLISLLNRVENIFQTIHPCEATFTSYGHEIRNLLILACTEIESQWKGVLETNNYVANGRYSTADYVKVKKPMKLDEYGVNYLFTLGCLLSIHLKSGISTNQPNHSYGMMLITKLNMIEKKASTKHN